jgi:CheY-like chemotaxis protein
MRVKPGERSSDHRTPRILIVEDDDDQRSVLAELLAGAGYDVDVACDGQEAVELLRDGLEPSLILLDLNMPRMDGWSFLQHLRGVRSSDVPVLVTSARSADRPPGSDACIEKPIDPRELSTLVAGLTEDEPGRASDAQ